SRAYVLHDPALDSFRIEKRLASGIDRREDSVESVSYRDARLDFVARRLALRRLRGPAQRQVLQNLDKQTRLVCTSEVDARRYCVRRLHDLRELLDVIYRAARREEALRRSGLRLPPHPYRRLSRREIDAVGSVGPAGRGDLESANEIGAQPADALDRHP